MMTSVCWHKLTQPATQLRAEQPAMVVTGDELSLPKPCIIHIAGLYNDTV